VRPTQDLAAEHRAIERMLAILAAVAARLEAGRAVAGQDLTESIGYLRGIVDRCHHRKEEQWLFPALESIGIAHKGGPIGALMEEHRLVRSHVQVMARAAQRLGVAQHDAAAAAEFAREARAYIDLVRAHIYKEESELFTTADARLSADEQARLETVFARIQSEEMGPVVDGRSRTLLARLETTYL
jgi:hemerythrin-like domain-containing protein